MLRHFRLLRLFAFGLVVATAASSAAAQEGVDSFGPFHLVAGQPGTLSFEGPVLYGSAGMLLWAIETAGVPERLVLNSTGGSVEDALFVADLVRTRRIATEIPEGAVCHSACVLVFFAGVGRQATGELGVHRPMEIRADGTLVDVPLLTRISQDTLRRFGASEALIELAWATPFDDMRVLTAEEIATFGVNRTREEGLALAPSEDLPPREDSDDDALDPLALVADFAPGVNLTFQRTGQPNETHVGAVKWEVGERQGTVRATVAIPDLSIAYLLLFGPFTDDEEPYLYGGILLSKVGATGPATIEAIYELALGLAAPEDERGVQFIQIGQATRPMTVADTFLALPRITRELNVDRLSRAIALQLILSVDRTLDNLVQLNFDIDANGQAALARAIPAWTGD
ncbi:MAG: hypothetical protein KIS68_08930 [Bauldia sp.]|nr:hypothetical protein [Bauldia sp.]